MSKVFTGEGVKTGLVSPSDSIQLPGSDAGGWVRGWLHKRHPLDDVEVVDGGRDLLTWVQFHLGLVLHIT